MVERAPRRKQMFRRLAAWGRQIGFERRLAVVLMTVGGILGVMTFLVLTDVWRAQQESSARIVTWLLLGDLIIALALGTIVARRLVLLWASRRRGLAGARLHARLVLLFGLIAVIPTVVVSVFSTTFLDYGLNTWFGERVRSAIESSTNDPATSLQRCSGTRSPLLPNRSAVRHFGPCVRSMPQSSTPSWSQ